MGILNVNKIQPVGSGQTVTVSATNINAGSATLTAGTFSGASDLTNLTVSGASDLTNLTVNGNAYPNAGPLSNRNKIINGDMRIDQRNAGASVTGNNNVYAVDRFKNEASQTSKLTVQQNAGAVTPPSGFDYYCGATSSSSYSVGASDYFQLCQYIEGYNVIDLAFGSASASSVTLSFWVRSSLTGTFGGALRNGATDRSYPFTYIISTANTWEYKTVTIPGDTTGTWLTNNGTGLFVGFALGVGSTYSGTAGEWASTNYVSVPGATSVVGTSGATFYITGVQLEAGTVATPFEHRSYGEELALCQRYYYEYPKGNTYNIVANGFPNTTSNAIFHFQFPVLMRTAPVVATTGNWEVIDGTSHSVTSFSNSNDATTLTARVDATSSGLTVGRGCMLRNSNDATATFSFFAEL